MRSLIERCSRSRAARRPAGIAIGLSLLAAIPAPAVAAGCPNEALRVGASAALSDCRAFEQVTPVSASEKNGTSMVGDLLNVLYASPGGEAASYYSVTGTNTESSAEYPIYVARRLNGNWVSDGINPPAALGSEVHRLAYTENMLGSFSQAGNPTLTEPNPYGFYYREFGGRITKVASASYNYNESLAVAAESGDGNVVLFESRDPLAAGGLEGFNNVYAWTKSTGALTLVDKLPDESTPAEGAFAGPWAWNGEFVGEGGAKSSYYTRTALNRAGTQAIFTAASAEEAGTYQVYVRENLASVSAGTTMVSASQKTNGSGPGGKDPNGPKNSDFLEATPDGKYVFFKSHSALTNDANTGPADEGQDLYRYDVESEELLDIAPLAGGAGAEVLGLAGVSNDGTYAYFDARGNLAAGATAGRENLFMWHQGSPIDFVATTNIEEPGPEIWAGTRYVGNFLGQKAARVSLDGRAIAFNATGPEPGAEITPGTAQVFRWEVGGSGLQCLSCNPAGRTEAKASFQSTPELFIQPEMLQSVATRNMSANGRRVFFSTSEPLLPSDTNGVEDVYEWEAAGEGSCTGEERNGGCILLISSGTSPDRSYFDDASATGNDVFFFTDQSLVAQDKDELYDVYDARVGGGIVSQNALPPIPCESAACRGPATSPGSSQGRGTSTFNGPENPVKKSCRKGFVSKGGKCVKQQKKKKNQNKKKNRKTKPKNARTSGGDR